MHVRPLQIDMACIAAGAAHYASAAAPLLQSRIRIAAADLSAAPISRLTFVPGPAPRAGFGGDDSSSGHLLTLGGQPADEPGALALVPLPKVISLYDIGYACFLGFAVL